MKFLAGAILFAGTLVLAGQWLPDWLGWAGGGFLVLFGGLTTIGNWSIPFRKGGGSLIPLLGGLFVAAGFAVVPVGSINSLWWVPLFVDLGCVPMFKLLAGLLLYRSVFTVKDDSSQL